MTSSMPQRPSATVLREIDLGRHHLLLLSDQRIELMPHQERPSLVVQVLSLDLEETYCLLTCLQDLFKHMCE